MSESLDGRGLRRKRTGRPKDQVFPSVLEAIVLPGRIRWRRCQGPTKVPEDVHDIGENATDQTREGGQVDGCLPRKEGRSIANAVFLNRNSTQHTYKHAAPKHGPSAGSRSRAHPLQASGSGTFCTLLKRAMACLTQLIPSFLCLDLKIIYCYCLP